MIVNEQGQPVEVGFIGGSKGDPGYLRERAELRTMLTEARARIAGLEQERDAYRNTAERHLSRLRHLEEVDKEHAECDTHIRVLIDHRDHLIRQLADQEAGNAAFRAALEALIKPFVGYHGEHWVKSLRWSDDTRTAVSMEIGAVRAALRLVAASPPEERAAPDSGEPSS